VLIEFITGFFVSSIIFYTLNRLFPAAGMGDYDEVDVYGTFSPKEAAKMGVVPVAQVIDGETSETSVVQVQDTFDKPDEKL
jgi:NCS1 family nucleobase:cation symporter-1